MSQCKPKHFECLPGECIPSPWVCDEEEVKFKRKIYRKKSNLIRKKNKENFTLNNEEKS